MVKHFCSWMRTDTKLHMSNVVYLPVKREPRSCINELDSLKKGDVLLHDMTDHEIEVVSTKEAPLLYRVRCMEDGT